ncbi:coiled-coil domain-containing protein 180 isoform X2 [Epinephelus fuscoguttatus]|uniref:coiled-coil domain-containing protein 180 isoform X2 n=1 Tax=Epinephelus fuscoguttatus TaxID=293821 RepID=UPI0020D1E470|nr:coiled-coil domain-containing protein 180 isoform X2 [Epinephelus fuscoguttatus]
MCESRAVPSGKVYRQLFDAQVQLSRSLLAGRKDTRTDCLSAEDSVTHCSTTSRLLCPPSSRGQQVDDDDDVDDVSRLPDSVVVDQPSSDIIERLTERKNKKHKEALKQLETELTHLSQECESQARTISVELLSSLQDVDLRLNNLKDRMEHLDHLSVQEVCVLWEEVEEEVKMKKIRIMELNHKLIESETQRAAEIKVVLRTFLHLLQKINFLSPPDVCRLVHAEATMLNQSLLANRRSVARLLLLLQEENLQQESLLRLHWEDCLSRWRRSRVTEVIDRFRRLCCSDEEQQLVSGQLDSGQLDSGQLVSGQLDSGQLVSGQLVSGQLVMQDLTGQRDDIISKISSLVPPSTALVSDWSNQLTAVNQQIDSLHTDFLHQLRCCYEQKWQDRLAEVERCKEALSALQLAEEEVNNIVSSQLLILIGQHQRQDEERLAALDLCCDSVARHAFSISRRVFVVMQGAALQWETHNHRLERKKEDLQQHLDDLRHTQQQHIQRKKVHLDDLLRRLRQEGSEEALKRSLDKTVHYLQDVKSSCGQCVSDQWEVLSRLPSVLLEELLSYSSSLSSFFHLDHTYKPSPEELQKLHPSSAPSTQSETSGGAETQKPEETTQSHPIRCQNDTDPAQPSQDWLTEAESSLLDLCDTSSDVTFTSPSGVTYSGPTFRCPTLNLQQKTHLSLFPVELLTDNLNRMRTLFFDHLEQRFHDVLSWGVATVTDRKEVVRLEQEVQLQQLNPKHIENHIYQQRLAELQLHRQQVDTHCEEVSAVLDSCREELRELQTSVSRRNQEFIVSLSNMEEDDQSADSRQWLEAVSSALQDCLDQHIKDTQQIQTYFRRHVQLRLQEVRNKTTHLLTSFRLFSEGGDFAPQEVKQFQRKLKEETRQIRVTEESIFSELELFESQSLQQVKEASGRMEEKLCLLRSELEFTEEIQKISSSIRVQIKAQAACSNLQQEAITSRLEELRKMMEDTQVCTGQVCRLLSSVSEDLRRRSQYLDISLESTLQERRSACHKSRTQIRSALPQTSGTAVDILDDPLVDVVKSLSWLSLIQDPEGAERAPAAGQSPTVPHVQQRGTESVNTLSVKRSCRSARSNRRFQVFGVEPEKNPHSLSSTLNSVLWKASDVLLQVAKDFYRCDRCGLSKFFLVPDSLDQWADSMQQRLLGFQEQTRKFLSTSREELETQLSMFEELLHSLPAVLISNHERQQGAGLTEEVGRVRLKMEEMLASSEEQKRVNIHQLRVSLRNDRFQSLNSREELRQQQLHSAVCSTHQELQVCVRARGEEFVTSLASLTEQLLSQLDLLVTPEETEAHKHQDTAVTIETGAETGRKPCTVSRTWPGIPYLLPSSVTMATTASITTTRCTLGHLAVIEQRDAAVKMVRSELSRSDDDKRRRLSEIHTWNTHWRQQIHTLTHTH